MLKGPIEILIDANISDITDKVYPLVAPQNTALPYVTLAQTGKSRAGKDCAWNVSFDVMSHAVNYDDVEAIDLAAVSALDGNSFVTDLGVTISFINLDSTRDEYVFQPNAHCVKISSFSAVINESTE